MLLEIRPCKFVYLPPGYLPIEDNKYIDMLLNLLFILRLNQPNVVSLKIRPV